MTCKLNADTSDGLKIVSDTSGEIDLQIDASTKVHMASDGKVGIGTASQTNKLEVVDSDFSPIYTRGSGNVGGIRFGNSSHTNGYIYYDNGANMNFHTSGSERMRINSSGQLLVGTTGVIDGSNAIGQFLNVNGGRPSLALGNGTGSSATNTIIFINSNGTVGSIQTSGSGTSFNTSSDYRLKENVDYTFDATSRLKQLKPARFNFKADADTTLDGFLAHEVSSIVPEAVVGTKDETETYKDDNGDDQTRNKYQGIDQAKLVPLLVKTIQELEARITALES